jgi:hypothetical protein
MFSDIVGYTALMGKDEDEFKRIVVEAQKKKAIIRARVRKIAKNSL